jgi:1-acyl-sn-glycerol-3-phosphate acyltransferase
LDRITNSDSYQTPRIEQNWLSRHFPSLGFYTKVVSTVWKASQKARKGLYDSMHLALDSQQMVHNLERVGVRFHIEHLNVLKELRKPCVFIGNHMSALETFILPGLLLPFREITFVVKKSLVSYPFFKHIMISRDPVVVGRENPREDLKIVLREGVDRLREKISVVIFPQRTRTIDREIHDFNTIGIKLAQSADVPVVPFALRTDAWGNGKLIKDLGKISPNKPVHFYFGNPLVIRGNGREIHNHIVSLIRGKLQEWF